MYDRSTRSFATCQRNNSWLIKKVVFTVWFPSMSFLHSDSSARNKWSTDRWSLYWNRGCGQRWKAAALKILLKICNLSHGFEEFSKAKRNRWKEEIVWLGLKSIRSKVFFCGGKQSQNIQSGYPCWVQRLITEFWLWNLKLFIRIKSLSDVTFCWLRNWTSANFRPIFLWYFLPFCVTKHEFR